MLSDYPSDSPEHLLHRLYAEQCQFLHISPQAMQQIAVEYHLPVSQVASVVAFYSFFHTKPCGRYHILFSNCTSCGYLTPEHNLMQMLCEQLQVIPGKTRQDGAVSIGETSCIGMCDQGPSLLINGIPLPRLNPERINQIAHHIASEVPVSEWPQNWFAISDNLYQRSLLLTEQLMPGSAVQMALMQGTEATLRKILQSGLRGRGGAGFNTAQKWQSCRTAPGNTRYVVCNADEGEPGTFKDRFLLQRYADALFEGMTICAAVIGASKGILYLRGEYRYMYPHLVEVLERRRKLNLLGQRILGQTAFQFDIDIVVGAGAYICGEESALIESLEGKPGIPRIRPPFPVTHGYLGQPTVVNNVETFIAAAWIALKGNSWFKSVGTKQSSGTKILSISGDCEFPGIYEYPFGTRIQHILEDCHAQNVQAVQMGGPSGKLINARDFDRVISFEDISTGGSMLIFGARHNLLAIHRNFAHFFAHESCGFCTPCRVGTQLLKKQLDNIANGRSTIRDIEEIKQLSSLIQHNSHCGLGHTAANHIIDGLQLFPQVFEQNLQQDFTAQFDLDQALANAEHIAPGDNAAIHLD
ncbi:NADP oxidoreductase [Nitrosomonas sp. JL21]|nr:NAD(P)H-dependent oxidoreductase subunit E [Nitrosomonas sp.]MXS76820.1 NADP oxidoreductase [Nitrosomonas sp. JL21]